MGKLVAEAIEEIDEGVVEAIEQEGNPNFLAVQWHPELSAAADPAQQGLFDRLTVMAAG